MVSVQLLKLLSVASLCCFIPLAAGAQEKRAAAAKLLTLQKAPPVYVRNQRDKSKWPGMVREGVDAGREYFGNYGPVFVYILGHEDKRLSSEAFHRRLVAEYCKHRGAGVKKRREECRDGPGAELIKKAISGRGDAYLSFVGDTDPPLAELVFINPHQFRDPYLYTRGIHEYTHVFQRAFPSTPTWMTEGGAEFFACYLGEKKGWAKLRRDMAKFMKNAQRAKDAKLGIKDMEDVDEVSPAVKKYYRHLAYDAGAWAFALMIHKSKSRSIAEVPKKFYPLVAKVGWQRALAQYAQVDNKQAFYRAFDAFLKLPLDEQLKMLEGLKE